MGLHQLIVLMFLPQFLLALATTLDWRSKNSLLILLRHPSLLLLPPFTFFTFARLSRSDRRVKFSQSWTWLNLGLTVATMLGYTARLYHRTGVPARYYTMVFLSPGLILLPVVFTMTFLHLNRLPGGSLQPPLELAVFDPDKPYRLFVFRDGHVIEVEREGELSQNEEETNFGST